MDNNQIENRCSWCEATDAKHRVKLGCKCYVYECDNCWDPILASRVECDSCRYARYRAGQFRWYEDKNLCLEELNKRGTRTA
jgi:hypothetical protein